MNTGVDPSLVKFYTSFNKDIHVSESELESLLGILMWVMRARVCRCWIHTTEDQASACMFLGSPLRGKLFERARCWYLCEWYVPSPRQIHRHR